MPTTYHGIAEDSSTPIDVAIVQATPGTPIIVEATGHGLIDGDEVYIYGHESTVEANGTWRVTRIAANTFSLDTSAMGAAAADADATGFVTPLARAPALTIPADGDARSAASVNVATEAVADRLAWLETRMGAYYLKATYKNELYTQALGGSTKWAGSYSVTNAAWVQLTDCDLWLMAGVHGDIQPLDLIEVDFTATVDTLTPGGHGKAFLRLFSSAWDCGVADPGPTNSLDGSGFYVADSLLYAPVHLKWTGAIKGGITYGSQFNVYVQAFGGAAGATTFDLVCDAKMECKVWRPR